MRDADFSPDGEVLVTGIAGTEVPGGNLRLWDVATGEALGSKIQTSYWCSSSVFAKGGDLIFAVSGLQPIHCYDAVTGTPVRQAVDDLQVQRLAISPDGAHLASSNTGESGVQLWSTSTLVRVGQPLLHGNPQLGPRYSFHQQGHHAACFAFWPDGRSILTSNSHGDLQLWDVATCTPAGAPKRHNYGICALAVASDGKLLAVGGSDHHVRLLDWETLQPVGAEMEHAGRITSVTFTPNRQLVLTSSVDGSARVWHVPTGLPVGPSIHHQGPVNTVKSSPDARWAATASDDRTAKIRRLPGIDGEGGEATAESLEALVGLTSTGDATVRFLRPDEWESRRSATTSRVERLLRAPAEPSRPADSSRRRIDLLVSSSRSKSADATAAIEGTMADEISQLRAIQLLRVQDTPEAAGVLGELYATGGDPVRLKALSALQQMKDPAARQAIRREIVASDDFSHGTALNWEVVNHDPARMTFDRDRGVLKIRAHAGEVFERGTRFKNLFLIPNPAKGKDFQLTVSVTGFKPMVPWQQAALLCWTDEDNYLKLAYEAGELGVQQLVLFPEVGGIRHKEVRVAIRSDAKRIWLRLTRGGESCEFASSEDGESFVSRGTVAWKVGEPRYVGLTAIAPGKHPAPPEEIDVSFDSFEVAILSPPGNGPEPTK